MKNTQNLRSLSRSRLSFAMPRGSARAGAAALCLIAASTTACSNKPTPTPDKEPLAPSAAPSAGTVALNPTASAAAEPKAIPTLALEKFSPADVHLTSVYAVDGAIMVVDEFRVGRVVGENVEWIGKIPPEYPGFGPNRIDDVVGAWPDSIGVVYSNTNGRAPQPRYLPVTGVGLEYIAAPGGGLGDINGVARVGGSTIVAAYSYGGAEIVTVRGTAKRKMQTPAEAGCKPGEISGAEFRGEVPAVAPSVLEATRESTLVSIGRLCEKRGPAAEVWDKNGKSRIVELTRYWKTLSFRPRILKGSGDELFAISDSWSPVLHYRNGEFEQVPDVGRPIKNIFVSARGELHANDGQAIHRYEDGKWIPVGKLVAPDRFWGMVMDDKDTIWAANGTVNRLRPTPGATAPAAPEGCSTPFVYLYEVSSKNDKKFTYPSTRKALSTFPEVAALGLVEFEDDYERRLGITVTSKAQGEAVIAHLKETMKEESPRLLCFAPKDPRTIDMNAKK